LLVSAGTKDAVPHFIFEDPDHEFQANADPDQANGFASHVKVKNIFFEDHTAATLQNKIKITPASSNSLNADPDREPWQGPYAQKFQVQTGLSSFWPLSKAKDV